MKTVSKLKGISILVVLISISLLFSQILGGLGGGGIWGRISIVFGGDNFGCSIQVTRDGKYILAGMTSSDDYDYVDVYLVKVDASGNLMWEKTFGGAGLEFGFNVQATDDGGYIIAGSTTSIPARSADVYLVKVGAFGNLMWEKTFGGAGSDFSTSVQETFDNGYIVAGFTNSFGAGGDDVYLVKVDASGNLMWEKTFGGAGDDYGISVQAVSDGGYLIAGFTNSFGNGDDVYLVKVDASGNLMWENTFGGAGNELGINVQQAVDGGYIIAGMTFGPRGDDVYLVKVDASGNLMWEKTFGGTGDDLGISVQQAVDGGYIISGMTNSFSNGNFEVYLVKTDSAGNKQWEKNFHYEIDTLIITATGPVDLAVTDPDGLIINKLTNQIPNAKYEEIDYDVITIPRPKNGNYFIEIISEPDAAPSDTYTLKVIASDATTTLAENVPISEIPTKPYKFNTRRKR